MLYLQYKKHIKSELKMSNSKNISYQRSCKICGNTNLKKVIKIQKQYLSPTFVKSNYKNPLTKIRTPLTLVLCVPKKYKILWFITII